MVTPDLAYFQSIPWCASLIKDSLYSITPTDSRAPKKSTEDALFGATLNTSQTISACVSLYKKPLAPGAQIEEVRTLLALGSGLNGYPNVCHGGIVATILDEVMGVLLSVSKDWEETIARADGRSAERLATVTAGLSVQYLRPVTTPQIVCVTVRLCKKDGRKIWLEGVIKDDSGAVLAKGESLFILKSRERL